MEELALKYYLDKVCICILEENNGTNCRSANNMAEKLKKFQREDSQNLSTNITKVGIKKFSDLFSTAPSTDFKSFKEAYRLVVGHAFYRAHKGIENYKLKNKIKLKLFCCHVINRVFDKGYVHELFKYYYEWLCDKKKALTFNLKELNEWMEEERTERLIETVEIINNKFYKKSKWFLY